jgi:hypothetical protein
MLSYREAFVSVAIRAGRIASKKQKTIISKSQETERTDQKTKKPSASFKSEMWYSGLAASIGIKPRAQPRAH